MNNINFEIISDKSDSNLDNFTINDIKKIWKKQFIELSTLECDLHGWKDKLNKDVKLVGKLYNFFIFECNKIILIGFYNSVAKAWYKIKSINELHVFIDYFQNENKVLEKDITIYLNSKFTFKQLIQYFYKHEFLDKTISSENGKIQIKNITLYDEILLLDKFLDSVTCNSNITFKTKYSGSKIVLSYVDEIYYIKISYAPLKLYNRFKILSKDLPSDVDLVLLNLNILRTEDIIQNMPSIEEKDIDILFHITNKDKLKEIMLEIIESKPDLKDYITKKIGLIDMSAIFNKIEKDGTFKAFENSLDILLKTIYERFNDAEYDHSENMLDLNKKIKDKITNIFESKIFT